MNGAGVWLVPSADLPIHFIVGTYIVQHYNVELLRGLNYGFVLVSQFNGCLPCQGIQKGCEI